MNVNHSQLTVELLVDGKQLFTYSDRICWKVKPYKRRYKGKTEKIEYLYFGFGWHEMDFAKSLQAELGGLIRNSKRCNPEIYPLELIVSDLDDTEVEAFCTQYDKEVQRQENFVLGIEDDWGFSQYFQKIEDPSTYIEVQAIAVQEELPQAEAEQEPAYELQLIDGDNIQETYQIYVAGEPMGKVFYHKIFQSWSWKRSVLPLGKEACIQQVIADAQREKRLFPQHRPPSLTQELLGRVRHAP